MHAEPVDSLNNFNDPVFLTPVCLFATIQVVLFIDAVPFLTPYCLPLLLAKANQITCSRTGKAPYWSRVYKRKSRLYGQYTRQDHPMANTEKILQCYKICL